MKKKIGLLFVFVLMLSVFVACGPDDEDEATTDEATTENNDTTEDNGETNTEAEKPKKLIVWEDQDKGVALEDAAKKFEEEHGIKIEFVEYNITKMQENMALDGNTENAPDVVTMSHDGVGPSVVKGYIAPIEVSDDVQSQYTESSVEALMYEGKLYGLPKATETPVFIYNKDLLPEVPETMEEIYTLSQEATSGDNYGFLAIWDDFYHAHGIFHGHGAYVFGDDVSDIGLNNDNAVEAMEYIGNWYEEGLFPSGIIGETSNDQLNALFKDGKAFAVQNGPWAFKDYQDAGINVGFAPMPKLPNGENIGTFMGVKGWFVTNFSENKEWAQKFVEFVSNEENAKTRYELTGEIPPLVSLIEDQAWVSENQGAAAVMAQSQFAVAMPSVPEMAEVWDPMKKAVQTVATGDAEPKDALNQAVETIQQNIEMNHSGN
ncbi:extracellular solute-binding protein [Salirhabdus sp. Marseille-P4669]|uniref:extracellular solute-binding protein n=1 Tax=Salirhabdus sp. Marseille-P4669 TaxID=2042310 RepID=UPI00190E8773|nr:extracellular solute-binding protein [Salirhabdus sp. Marseille-P4669]